MNIQYYIVNIFKTYLNQFKFQGYFLGDKKSKKPRQNLPGLFHY